MIKGTFLLRLKQRMLMFIHLKIFFVFYLLLHFLVSVFDFIFVIILSVYIFFVFQLGNSTYHW